MSIQTGEVKTPDFHLWSWCCTKKKEVRFSIMFLYWLTVQLILSSLIILSQTHIRNILFTMIQISVISFYLQVYKVFKKKTKKNYQAKIPLFLSGYNGVLHYIYIIYLKLMRKYHFRSHTNLAVAFTCHNAYENPWKEYCVSDNAFKLVKAFRNMQH